MKDNNELKIGGNDIGLGETKDIGLIVSQSYVGQPVVLPIRVIRGKKQGSSIFVSGAVHGDELSGVGIIQQIMENPPEIEKGTLILIPVTNVFGFENHSRYLPDRRDLNRCFPGDDKGSVGHRLAHLFFNEIVNNSDFGIDLHSAAVRRTNYPHIRADLDDPRVQEIAYTFGCEINVQSRGPNKSLRREACKAGCATVIYEAGEAFKFEPGAIEIGYRGVLNVLKHLGMVKGQKVMPEKQTKVTKSVWVRSQDGGILSFKVRPGDYVKKDEVLVECSDVFKKNITEVYSNVTGVIMGMTTLPAVKPGEPICHIGITPKLKARKTRNNTKSTLHGKAYDQMGSNFHIRD